MNGSRNISCTSCHCHYPMRVVRTSSVLFENIVEFKSTQAMRCAMCTSQDILQFSIIICVILFPQKYGHVGSCVQVRNQGRSPSTLMWLIPTHLGTIKDSVNQCNPLSYYIELQDALTTNKEKDCMMYRQPFNPRSLKLRILKTLQPIGFYGHIKFFSKLKA